jgi:hypothetical protein
VKVLPIVGGADYVTHLDTSRSIFPVLLNGWKQVCDYLGCSRRTAQRWAKSGMPIRRVGAGSRGHIMAKPDDLDNWIRFGSNRPFAVSETRKLIHQSSRLLEQLDTTRRDLEDEFLLMRQKLIALRSAVNQES